MQAVRMQPLQYQTWYIQMKTEMTLATISMIPPVVLCGIYQDIKQISEGYLTVDHHTIQKVHIQQNTAAASVWCKDTTVDSAKDDDRHQESPECLFKSGPLSPLQMLFYGTV